MVHQSHSLSHMHRRIRISSKDERVQRLFDKLVYIAGIIGPLMTLPQLYNIWVLQNAAGVSMMTWSAYLLVAITWLGYALFHKERPLIIMNGLWIVLDIMVIIGTGIYG